MSWLARLKSQKCPDDHATKATKPGFVGFVASLNGDIQKTEGDRIAANDPTPAPEPDANPVNWRELAQAYNAHHFGCHQCQAAGRGSRYGRRCAVGLTLWSNYTESV